MIHWLELPERPIHSHTHTHTPAKHMHVCNTHACIHLFLSRVRQPAARTQRENTQTHTHTRTLANQTEINPDRLRINSGYFAQCFIGIIPPLRSPLLKYPQCICMMNERPDDRLKINLSSIRQKRVYPVTQMST